MKKLFILALAAVMMAGCVENDAKGVKPLVRYSTVEIDSCEYVYGFHRLAHKGNCKYCEQRMKAELRELLIELKDK